MTRLALGNYALIALGVVAVISAAPAAHALGGSAEVQYVTATSVQMPAILKMFAGHNAGATTATTTISATRTRHDDGKGNSTIVQCDLRRLVTINDNAKTYTVVDFDDLMKQTTAAMAQAQAKSNQSAQKINGTGSTMISFDEKTDSQTQTIAGMTAHHAVDTITMSMQGTGDCPSNSQSMTMDVWYAPSPVKMSCPTKLAAPPAMGRGGSPCMQRMMIQANNMKSSQARIPLKTTMNFGMGPMTFSTTSTVTSVKTMPYDSTFFDVPAGYTKVDVMATPSHR